MFIRVKTTPNSPRKSVQIVESFRVDNKVKQKIVKHIGVALDDYEPTAQPPNLNTSIFRL